ncbi:PilZ domain-containing protein [Ferrimonas sediminicola]|uniref:PilZ domain-containing protein n=1 Tax=Ferrimonas sediminicola TaxID=2569538 RepID=A0A4U1BFR6_9GAMM|nr:PilZ domain-containing protein [Ferrimonas sediminicola]TKB49260.1 PilZ domain-containing protein [Ferrimonas sediminicola]
MNSISMEEHHDLINQLIPLLQDSSFDNLLDQATTHLSNSDRFLIRMELRRLNQECQRRIDLSGTGEIREYTITGLTHRLTEEARQFLEQQLELYEGRYTVGAYESLMSYLKGEPEQAEEEPEGAPAPFRMELLPMGHYIRRRETRHTFSSAITLWQPDGAPVSGRTQDLSIRGARIKTDRKWQLNPDLPIFVSYTELASEFVAPELKHGVSYKLVEALTGSDSQSLRLRRSDSDSGLDQTFERILSVSRLRTRPELNHLLRTAKSRGYERQYLPQLNSLPLAMSIKGGKLRPSLVLQTRANQAHLDYWMDERGHSQIGAALTEERLARVLKHPREVAHQLLFSFIHLHEGHRLFFSATLWELNRLEMAACFFKHGGHKQGFKLHRIQLHAISDKDKEWACHSPVNGRAADSLVQQQLRALSLLINLESTDLGNASGFSGYDSPCHINQLRRFGQKRVSGLDPSPLACDHQELRREPRFSLQTRVVLNQGRRQLVAHSVDVSPRGLRLMLGETAELPSGEMIKVEFPELQPMAGKLKLKGLPYELVRCQQDKRTLHLKAAEGDPHAGVVFLSHLLSQNRSKIAQVGSKLQHRQLLEGMKNLILKRLYSLPFFVHKHKAHFEANLAGSSLLPSTTFQALTDPHGLSLEAILDNPVVKQHLEGVARSHDEGLRGWQATLLLHWPPQRELRKAWTLSEIGDDHDVHSKLMELGAKGHLKAVTIKLDRAQKPDLDYLQGELAAISTHALHRAKELEEMLWQIVVVGELKEVTAEILLEYRLATGETATS